MIGSISQINVRFEFISMIALGLLGLFLKLGESSICPIHFERLTVALLEGGVVMAFKGSGTIQILAEV